ncbi:MAG: DUF2721 domain-containing protein [Candidatus Electrothrix aestuarii]|uniref:DUF2721 domain-containing protein n=1 Tax=Candidatus Electrothrix aestuarii TaxID=3062594 RepID=A0AAU8LSZ2_9BACT|nr:DUF2721 domain-containing protein [Candidatus Electrothrix aestuarii]
MDLTLTSPALLFPAISLLLVAYTTRFRTISERIRILHAQFTETPTESIVGQIDTLRKRVYLIRNMQACGVASFFLCVLCLFTLFAGSLFLSKLIFVISLILLMISLVFSFWEVLLSVHALELQLSDIEKHLPKKKNYSFSKSKELTARLRKKTNEE